MKRIINQTALLIVTGLITTPVAASPPVLELSEAVEIALDRNQILGAADAGLEAARAEVKGSEAMRLPKVELHETFMRTTNPVYVFGNLLGQEAFGAEHFDPAFLNEPDALGNFNTKLTVTQPIWTAGRIPNAIAASRLASDAAEAGRERTRQQVVHQVIEAYTGAVLAGHHLQVAREALETVRANVKIVSDMKEAGLVVESDLLQARVRESEIEEMVIRAESAVSVSQAAVNLAIGRDLDTPFTLEKSLDPASMPEESVVALTEEALANRPDLLEAGNRADAAGRVVRMNKAGYMPEIGLLGSYEMNSEDLIGTDGTNWSVIVAARLTVFDWKGTRSRINAARERKNQAVLMRDLLVRSIGLEVRRAYHELRAADKRLEQAVRAVDMSRESLRIVTDRYKEGLTTLVELLDAETALTRARTREVAARRDMLIGAASLDLAVGRL
jgi:outer membrane protein TolC